MIGFVINLLSRSFWIPPLSTVGKMRIWLDQLRWTGLSRSYCLKIISLILECAFCHKFTWTSPTTRRTFVSITFLPSRGTKFFSFSSGKWLLLPLWDGEFPLLSWKDAIFFLNLSQILYFFQNVRSNPKFLQIQPLFFHMCFLNIQTR